MALSYINRKGEAHYFRAVPTKKGNLRYYVVKSAEYPNLIDTVPQGFEISEYPEDGRVVLRKVVPLYIEQAEKKLVENAIREFSAVKDFIVHAEGEIIWVYHSQFSYPTGYEESLSKEEARKFWHPEIEKILWYDSALRFVLVNESERLFQAERVVFLSISGNDFYPIGKVGPIEEVAIEFGQHLGKPSFIEIVPHGFDE